MQHCARGGVGLRFANPTYALDRLIDEVGEDKSHPLASLMEIEGFLIEGYEDWHVPELAE
ncbi:hypothetical protein THSYN_04495 [Candidatus Thiodictyon syntrophicum]|uniref:Uncharacterized protein n=1 Tax=Candidatus Thiodictyon syntrophicum TaxID=1166950 RepID=A0A2K8UGE2_9GAMM|nr:hypothetical protein THSYN_04495 [Candidatus Thiodictyon syntrophicum]